MCNVLSNEVSGGVGLRTYLWMPYTRLQLVIITWGGGVTIFLLLHGDAYPNIVLCHPCFGNAKVV